MKHVSYPGLYTSPQYELACRQMVKPEGRFAPGAMIYFVLQGDEQMAAKAAEWFINAIARHAYSITLAVSLGQIRTLIEAPYSMTHSALPAEVKQAHGLEPGGIRLSIGLEDWHDLIADLKAAFAHIAT